MKILYISSFVSESLFEELYQKSLTTGFTGQKYHGLFAKGLAMADDECHITALSQPPICKSFFKLSEAENKIQFRYVPIVSIPIIKQVISFIYTFLYTLYWCIKNIGQEKVIMSSLMRVYQYPSVALAALIFRCKEISIACDVPWMTTVQVSKNPLSVKQKLAIQLGKAMCRHFDGYIFLTETMNAVLNPQKRPYIVVEGFCDSNMIMMKNNFDGKNFKQIIIYAGGLNEKYGIKNLVDAVKILNDESIELWLYGTGDMTESLRKENHPCIKFYGPRSNQEVVKAELQSTILINPRPTSDEYTIYSFPSKTLEYMVSGTYTMTTRLAGIPIEYFDYCGVIDDYSAEGIADAIRLTLSESKMELHRRGLKAREFVLENKNNLTQARKVIEFIHGF